MRPLFHRGGGKAGEADHIAGGVDIGDICLEGDRIDLDAAAAVAFQAAGLKVETGGGAHSAGGEQHCFGADMPAAFHPDFAAAIFKAC